MKKKLLSGILALAIIASPSLGVFDNTNFLIPSFQITASAAQKKSGWYKEKGNWYFYINGKKAKNRWIRNNHKDYYLKKDGVMATGWEKIGENWYYFDPVNGDMYYNRWLEVPQKNQPSDWYFFDGNGIMFEERLLWTGGYYYYFEKGGKMVHDITMYHYQCLYHFDSEGRGTLIWG